MIEALKIIVMACQIMAPPQFGTTSFSFGDSLQIYQRNLLKYQLDIQRECQIQTVECLLEKKEKKEKWPLSRCLSSRLSEEN